MSTADDVVEAVTLRMQSFEAAQKALDSERLLDHFADVAEFRLLNDGEIVSYASMAATVRGAFPALQSIEGGFADLAIVAVGPDHVLASGTFTEAITDKSGAGFRQRGAVTWLWRHIGGEWRIVHGQVDHRPNEPRV